jgi:hypothetical protein
MEGNPLDKVHENSNALSGECILDAGILLLLRRRLLPILENIIIIIRKQKCSVIVKSSL